MTQERLAFASDYDGTLVRGVDTIQPQDVEAIKRFQLEGGLFGACSGRALNCVQEPAQVNGLDLDFIVASTGGVVIVKDKLVDAHPLDREALRQLVSDYGQTRIGLQTMERFLVNFELTSPNQTRADSLEAVIEREDVFAVSLNFNDERLALEAAKIISQSSGGVLDAFQNVGGVDVVAHGCSKGAGLTTVREALGVDLLGGIGDSYNDVALLDAADKAYTFVNAPSEVQAHATRLVASVAQALEDFAA